MTDIGLFLLKTASKTVLFFLSDKKREGKSVFSFVFVAQKQEFDYFCKQN